MDARLCEKCGKSGHLKDKCKSAWIYRNYKLKGRNSDHLVLSTEYPEYIRILEREKARVNND